MTARQRRFGLRYQGPEVAVAKLSGQVEVDFFGGKAALGNGISMDLLRLRIAWGGSIGMTFRWWPDRIGRSLLR